MLGLRSPLIQREDQRLTGDFRTTTNSWAGELLVRTRSLSGHPSKQQPASHLFARQQHRTSYAANNTIYRLQRSGNSVADIVDFFVDSIPVLKRRIAAPFESPFDTALISATDINISVNAPLLIRINNRPNTVREVYISVSTTHSYRADKKTVPFEFGALETQPAFRAGVTFKLLLSSVLLLGWVSAKQSCPRNHLPNVRKSALSRWSPAGNILMSTLNFAIVLRTQEFPEQTSESQEHYSKAAQVPDVHMTARPMRCYWLDTPIFQAAVEIQPDIYVPSEPLPLPYSPLPTSTLPLPLPLTINHSYGRGVLWSGGIFQLVLRAVARAAPRNFDSYSSNINYLSLSLYRAHTFTKQRRVWLLCGWVTTEQFTCSATGSGSEFNHFQDHLNCLENLELLEIGTKGLVYLDVNGRGCPSAVDDIVTIVGMSPSSWFKHVIRSSQTYVNQLIISVEHM
ncbi:hypothetical protein J6590_032366 [Homalodisca vitripennis]|nr:hypothetical protein J6590_032366 [Homalodisca vitripennis]